MELAPEHVGDQAEWLARGVRDGLGEDDAINASTCLRSPSVKSLRMQCTGSDGSQHRAGPRTA